MARASEGLHRQSAGSYETRYRIRRRTRCGREKRRVYFSGRYPMLTDSLYVVVAATVFTIRLSAPAHPSKIGNLFSSRVMQPSKKALPPLFRNKQVFITPTKKDEVKTNNMHYAGRSCSCFIFQYLVTVSTWHHSARLFKDCWGICNRYKQ